MSQLDFINGLGIVATMLLIIAALLLQRMISWRPFAFSCWVLAFVTVALFFPSVFTDWGARPANEYIPLLIQVIMFGMGTTLSLADFARVLMRPRAVAIGMVLQFTVMPLLGWCLGNALQLPPEILVGVILIGACPGGVASNVITFLARGDVALSVTMTAISTLMAPVMTPLMMSLLASESIEVDFGNMFWQIINIVIAPTAGGLIANVLLSKLGWRGAWIDNLMSVLAMLSICVVIGIIVAQCRPSLFTVGPMVVLAAFLHNGLGYLLGYGGAKLMGLNESESRTVSIEVGMQNGGMGASLAINVLNSPQAALAPAVFGAWMSVSGSFLASFWRRSPVPVQELQAGPDGLAVQPPSEVISAPATEAKSLT